MEKIVYVDGKEIGFRGTALTPRLYRHKIGRDMVQDMNQLQKAFRKANSIKEPAADATEEEIEAYMAQRQDAQLSAMDLEIFENAAYIMAMQYNSAHDNAEFPRTPDEWLDTFSTFSVYTVCPAIMELWAMNNQTTSIPKKN